MAFGQFVAGRCLQVIKARKSSDQGLEFNTQMEEVEEQQMDPKQFVYSIDMVRARHPRLAPARSVRPAVTVVARHTQTQTRPWLQNEYREMCEAYKLKGKDPVIPHRHEDAAPTIHNDDDDSEEEVEEEEEEDPEDDE